MSFTNPMTNEIIIKHLMNIDKRLNEMNIKLEELMKQNNYNTTCHMNTTIIRENNEYKKEEQEEENIRYDDDSGWMKVNRRYKKDYKRL